MSNISPPFRGKSWVFQITALCIVLGMLLALALKTQRQALVEGAPNRFPAFGAAFRVVKQQNLDLQRELADYKGRYENLAKRQATGVKGSKGLEQALEEAKLLAGTVPVRGPGIVVTMHDSNKLDPAETRRDVIEQFMVHDSDIRNIVSELFAAGAEAISVNGQRLIANSSIRCVGPVVLVNSVQVAPPYLVRAIGKPDVLENALDLPGGAANDLFLMDMISVEKRDSIRVPAYTGSTRFSAAVPDKGK